MEDEGCHAKKKMKEKKETHLGQINKKIILTKIKACLEKITCVLKSF